MDIKFGCYGRILYLGVFLFLIKFQIACVPDVDCLDECLSPGKTKCIDGKLRTCEKGERACLNWTDPVDCESGICENESSCCIHQCPILNAGRCSDGQLTTCIANKNECRYWSNTIVCIGGECIDSTSCGHYQYRCSDQSCGADAWRRECDGDSCSQWIVIQECNLDQICWSDETGSGCTDCDSGCANNACIDYCQNNRCWTIPPTGQKSCYNDHQKLNACPGVEGNADCGKTAFCGQDAQIEDIEREFELISSGNGEDRILDSLTKLEWQRSYGIGTNWEQAKTNCDNLNYAGKTDWRLPNHLELASLIHYGVFNPSIDAMAFPNIFLDVGFWTSSAVTDGWAIWIWFIDGNLNSGQNHFIERTLCVRGQPIIELASEERFLILNDKQSVLDRATNLVWQKERSENVNWMEALAYCQNLIIGEYDHWRLPDTQELLSIVDHNYFDPATAFPDHFPNQFEYDGYPFWTSTTVAQKPSQAWSTRMYGGDVTPKAKQEKEKKFARCVRDIP